MIYGTESSDLRWLVDNSPKVDRYIRRNHKSIYDYDEIYHLLLTYPVQGRRLIESHTMTNEDKIKLICEFMIKHPQITCLIMGDQRYGKDGTACFFIEECLNMLRYQFIKVVTLGNIKKPPWVKAIDMYFSFANIPSAKSYNEVWVYCSELETIFPSREGTSVESRIFTQLEGTMAQNHQKLFGCVKLLSKVDLNVIRSANIKMFKFISRDKLDVENIERDGVLSGLGRLLLPKNPEDKSEVLVVFDKYLLKVRIPLVKWWNIEYSEMFNNISREMIDEYIKTAYSNNMKIEQIIIAIKQKFRCNISKADILKVIA